MMAFSRYKKPNKKIPGTRDTTFPLLLWFVIVVVVVAVHSTVPFHSICWSPITGPQKSMKCHNGHVHFGEVTKSFFDSKKSILKLRLPPTNLEKK